MTLKPHEVWAPPLSPNRFEAVLEPNDWAEFCQTPRIFSSRCSTVASCGTSTRPPRAAASRRCCARSSPTRAAPASTCAGWSSRATPDFFAVTKRLHNFLHGAPGDGGALGRASASSTRRSRCDNAEELAGVVRPGDVVLLHDPQTAGLVTRSRRAARRGVALPHRRRAAERAASSRLGLPAPVPRRGGRLRLQSRARTCRPGPEPPHGWSSSPRSTPSRPRTRIWSAAPCGRSSRTSGCWSPSVPHGARPVFTARTAAPGASTGARRHRAPGRRRASTAARRPGVALGPPQGPVRRDASASPSTCADATGAHLVLAGPDVSGVADDPEGAEVFDEVEDAWRALPRRPARADPPRLPADGRHRRERRDRQRPPAPRDGHRPEEPPGGLWPHRRRGDVEGTPGVASAVGGIQDQIATARRACCSTTRAT